MDPIFSQQFQMPPPKPQGGGMFGGGKFGIGQALVAALNGYLASQPGGAGAVGRGNIEMMAQAMQARQEQARREAEYQAHRQDSLTDYEAKQRIDQQYPNAPTPTEYERALEASGVMRGSPEWAKHMGNYVNVRENPPFTYVDPTTGAVMMGARTPPQQSAPQGVTFTPINDGGAGPSAPRPFPY